MPRDLPLNHIEPPAIHPRHIEIAIVEETERLLATPDRWCQGQLNKDGAMCLMGALHRAALWRKNRAVVTKTIERIAGCNLPKFNDTHTHADVLGLLGRVKLKFMEDV